MSIFDILRMLPFVAALKNVTARDAAAPNGKEVHEVSAFPTLAMADVRTDTRSLSSRWLFHPWYSYTTYQNLYLASGS